ncbi:isopeptide-forming domain-containing protein [Holdemanella biformis]|uniref:Gram-positive pilin subunit D1 N-terminal domain-containing protein n=1 Tax=Holdemanella biformis DSM 3989 TaxID=518637 RepID=B7CD06_9FIRM|nr:hypothetical protein [Holdemanella biformis]EEC89311.1 hypothetical protein EUBIFOR_02085 [Holdemanella biformis DSM 3989]
MIKQLKIHSLFLLLISLLFVSLIQVHADSRMGSIDIDYKGRTDNQEEIILSGAKFEIIPIQYVENEKWVWQSSFVDCGVSLHDTSAEARNKQAKQLLEYARKKGVSGNQQLTDSMGHALFSGLNEGMYLVFQIDSVKNGNDTFESAPFLVSIPSDIDGYLVYDVKVEPKVTWLTNNVPSSVPEKPSEKNPPEDTNTGVQVKKMTWIVLALCSFGMIVILGRRLKRK